MFSTVGVPALDLKIKHLPMSEFSSCPHSLYRTTYNNTLLVNVDSQPYLRTTYLLGRDDLADCWESGGSNPSSAPRIQTDQTSSTSFLRPDTDCASNGLLLRDQSCWGNSREGDGLGRSLPTVAIGSSLYGSFVTTAGRGQFS